MALLTEDRRDSGVVPTRSVFENAILAHMPRYANRAGHRGHGAASRRAACAGSAARPHAVAADAADEPLGRQPAEGAGRWLLWDPRSSILDEPTRGIDVGAKFEIYTIINELAAQGKGIIMISSELPEPIGESDRIVVMCRGRLTGIVDRGRGRGDGHAPRDGHPR